MICERHCYWDVMEKRSKGLLSRALFSYKYTLLPPTRYSAVCHTTSIRLYKLWLSGSVRCWKNQSVDMA